jgi:ribosome-associated toxin RatA of RatAB toxin-antitoxin module
VGSIVVEHVSDAPLERVYAVAKDVERFGEIMPDVESVAILEREGSTTVTKWVGIVAKMGRKIVWTERDHWDDEKHVCTFEQVEGDYDVYQGVWSFFATPEGGSRMTIELEVEIQIPLVGALLKNLVLKLTRMNAERMLEAIATEASR